MYNPIVKTLVILATAATLYAGNVQADEHSPYAIKPSSDNKAKPTLTQRLMKDYCASNKNAPMCKMELPTSPFGVSPEEALGMHTKK